MFFIIVRETSALLRPYGLRSSKASVGCSVARASEARVSMIKLTHNICTAFNGLSCIKISQFRPLFVPGLSHTKALYGNYASSRPVENKQRLINLCAIALHVQQPETNISEKIII